MKCGYLDPSHIIVTDHGLMAGLADDDHAQYLLASDATSRAAFATNWLDLTDSGDTTLHKHNSVRITITSIGHGLVAGDCVYFIP